MQFLLIPAGDFLMGSDETPADLARTYPQYDRERFLKLTDEAPVHRVRITRPFYLGRHEVTVGQFRRFLAASGHVPESQADGTGGYGYNPAYDPATSPRGDAFEGRDARYAWHNPGFPQGDDHPVLNVTWNDAQALADWLTRQEDRRYRLPTEAEWEYACRAGTSTRYQRGDDPTTLLITANTFDADSQFHWPQWTRYALPGSDGYAFTAPVGTFAANGFGLYDMHGNAWEWVADWYAADAYAKSPREDPQGPIDGDRRVRRGGSWHTWPLYARCAYRNWNSPRTRYTLVGDAPGFGRGAGPAPGAAAMRVAMAAMGAASHRSSPRRARAMGTLRITAPQPSENGRAQPWTGFRHAPSPVADSSPPDAPHRRNLPVESILRGLTRLPPL
jgi:formylglycine-generating enzyme required for sulfatase activity